MIACRRFEQGSSLNARSLFALVLFSVGFSQILQAPAMVQADDSKCKVKLVIDYGDGVQKHFLALPCEGDCTVLDVMQAAKKHPRGISFVFKGKNSTALLTKIDDVQNEGAGRNWLYSVNGKLADRSFGIFEVSDKDTILWEFRKYR